MTTATVVVLAAAVAGVLAVSLGFSLLIGRAMRLLGDIDRADHPLVD